MKLAMLMTGKLPCHSVKDAPRLRDQIGDVRGARFVRGVVLYAGSEALSFGDRLEALPLASLWLPRGRRNSPYPW